MTNKGRVRMRCSVYLLVILLTLGAAGANGETSLKFNVSPTVRRNFGETTYELKLAGRISNDPNVDSILTIRSKLGFPTDVTMVGGHAELAFEDETSTSFA